ncbi:MAG: PHP domain-containing protein [Acutalibacteraceae bacterium]
MNKYYYDLHIHSCLSPCGDNDMTPANLAGMAALGAGIAVTDHNTRRTPAFSRPAAHGIVPIAGMELTRRRTSTSICLFETLEAALALTPLWTANG